jgi:hypothetical protein
MAIVRKLESAATSAAQRPILPCSFDPQVNDANQTGDKALVIFQMPAIIETKAAR